MNNEIDDYKDIIDMKHHVSSKHPRLSTEQRAAQFAPFAALTGFSDEVDETSRLTDKKIELDEEQKIILDRKIQILQEKIKEMPEITITYFIKDKLKDGGAYVSKVGNIKKVDTDLKKIVMIDFTNIPIDDILEIRGEIINKQL